MNQALQSNHQGSGEESERVDVLVENYMKKNTELYDIETLITVSNTVFDSNKIIVKRAGIGTNHPTIVIHMVTRNQSTSWPDEDYSSKQSKRRDIRLKRLQRESNENTLYQNHGT